MNGPKFDGSGKIVEREVNEADVGAYLAAGYVHGKIEIKTTDEAVADIVANMPREAVKVEPDATAPAAQVKVATKPVKVVKKAKK